MKAARICRIYVCRAVGKALCCADCWMRDECPERCLNWPSRCKCTVRRTDCHTIDPVAGGHDIMK